MLKTFLNSKIHNAKVTDTHVNYEGSLGIDEDLMDLAGISTNERVDVYDITNGERLATYAIPIERGSKKISILGAAARKIKTGDRIIIATYVQIAEDEWPKHRATTIHLDESNNPV